MGVPILSKYRGVIPFLKLSVDLEEESFYNDMLKAWTQEQFDNRENAKFITHGWIFQCTDVISEYTCEIVYSCFFCFPFQSKT